MEWLSPKLVTSLLINLAAIVERVDEQLLPSVYAFVAATFNAKPSTLGALTFTRALFQALSSPLGGYLGHYYQRGLVIGGGCCLWSAMTCAFGTTTTIALGLVFWGINGVGLAMVIPASQSMIADYYSTTTRGKAFGLWQFTANLGGMLGALWGTNIGHLQPFGIEGWRLAFMGVGLVSLAIGLLNIAFSTDPRTDSQSAPSAAHHHHYHRASHHQRQASDTRFDWKQALRDMRDVCRVPTFVLIIVQGIMGSFPWPSLNFCTLYFQLIGMSHANAAMLFAMFMGASSLGALLGGAVGDAADQRWRDHGRIACAQFSVGIGVPLFIVIFKMLPRNGDASTVAVYAGLLVVSGLLISWCSSCNNPIFAEIVPERQRTLIYAFDRSFEGAIAAMGTPVTGLLAEWWGFSGAATVTRDASDLHKADALANALLMCTAIPWTLCCVFYGGLHWTYPKDRQSVENSSSERGAYELVGREDDEGSGTDFELVLLPSEHKASKHDIPMVFAVNDYASDQEND